MRGTRQRSLSGVRTTKGGNGRAQSTDTHNCFDVARRGLSAAAPMLQDLGAGEVLDSGVKALQSYDTVRKQVMDVDDKGRSHYDRIAQAIK